LLPGHTPAQTTEPYMGGPKRSLLVLRDRGTPRSNIKKIWLKSGLTNQITSFETISISVLSAFYLDTPEIAIYTDYLPPIPWCSPVGLLGAKVY
jgi:hypothetical protein